MSEEDLYQLSIPRLWSEEDCDWIWALSAGQATRVLGEARAISEVLERHQLDIDREWVLEWSETLRLPRMKAVRNRLTQVGELCWIVLRVLRTLEREGQEVLLGDSEAEDEDELQQETGVSAAVSDEPQPMECVAGGEPSGPTGSSGSDGSTGPGCLSSGRESERPGAGDDRPPNGSCRSGD